MSEIPRNRSFSRATHSQSKSDSLRNNRLNSLGSEDSGEEIVYSPDEFRHSNLPTRSGSADGSSMYGLSPSLSGQSSWRRPSGASNLSNSRRPSGPTAMSRRPSSSSGPWSSRMSNDSSNFSVHTAAQSPSISPSTPKNRTSSRSKILASSAQYLGHSPPIAAHSPKPHSRDSSFSTDVSLLPPSVGAHQAGKGSILVSTATGQSLLERKRRLAVASGNSIYDDVYTETSSISTTSQRRVQQNSDQGSNVSSGDSVNNRRNSIRQHSGTLRSVAANNESSTSEISSGGRDDSPNSIKKRLFGSKKEKNSPNEPSTPSRSRTYRSQNRPSTGNDASPSLLEKESYEMLDNEQYYRSVPSSRGTSGRTTTSVSSPNRQNSEPFLRSQREYKEPLIDYSRSASLQGLGPPAVLHSEGFDIARIRSTSNQASLRSSPSESSIIRSQNEGINVSERPSSRGHRRNRTNSKSSASVHSIASTSNGSIPARTTSLKQNPTVPSSPSTTLAALVSPSSSYKSIPTSPDLQSAEDTTLSSSPIKASLNRSNFAKHSSWRQSSSLNTAAAAAGVSGASALAAIRASFGEPARQDVHEVDQSEQSDITNSLSFAALRILEEPDSSNVEDGGIEATMSKLTGNGEGDTGNPDEDLKLGIPLTQTISSTSSQKEPLRPIKSSLRGARNRLSTVASESGHEPRSIVSPSGGQDVTPSKESYIESSRRTNELSPPRKSIEEMSVVDVMMSNDRLSGSGSAINVATASESRSSLHHRNQSQSSTSNNGSLTHLPGDSVLSFSTDDGTEGPQGKSEGSKFGTKRYKTLAKVTPGVFNKGFGKSSSIKQLNSASPSVENLGSSSTATNVGLIDDNASSISSNIPPRKKSIWRLGIGKEDSSVSGHDNVSSKNKLGMSIRGRKSDAHTIRPTIRRVFDHPNTDDSPGNHSFTDGQHTPGEDSKGSTPTADRSSGANTAHGSYSTMREISRDSLHRDVGPDSPATAASGAPQTPSENLPSELKRIVRRCNAIRELVETEKTYAADLAIVRDVYLARAKALAGFSMSSPLTTPLSSTTTPIFSPSFGTPTSMQNHFQPSSANYLAFKGTPPTQWSSNSIRHQASSEAPLASPAQIQSSSATLSSNGPSNRSSTYTVSSNTSSELSFHWPPNGSSLPGTPSIGAPSSTHKSINASSGSPAPSLQQQQQQHHQQQQQQQLQSKGTPMNRIQTSVSGTPTLTNDGPLSSSDIRIIFAHLETCCTLAFDMTALLNSSMGSLAREKVPIQNGRLNVGSQQQDDDRIGNLFVSLMPRIEAVYTAYCSRHEASVLRFQDLITNSPKAANFFRDCNEKARKNTTSWDLASLLIKPVQRVLKYPLLLRQIIGLTDEAHPDHAQLMTALAQIQEVADKINQVKRRKDLADYIITGRDREIKAGTSSPLSTLPAKGKKKQGMLTPRSSNTANTEESMLNIEALDKALEEYAELSKKFEALQSRVAIFGRQCGTWSHAVRECYYAQLRMLGYLRRVYTLRPADEGENGIASLNAVGSRGNLPSGPEDATVAAYMDVLKTIINRSWRQMDTEIRTAILPMTTKIEKMFDAPRMVMIKVDERENDFARARLALQQEGASAKSVDRKILENANGYVALQAQLIDEMPTFMRGIQLLLDVGVQAFARLQAAHLDEVRNLTIEFWSTKAGHEDEVEMIGVDEEDTLEVGPSLRNVNLVRSFWESHRAYSQWSESLAIARRGSEMNPLSHIDYDDLSDSDEDKSGEAEFEEALAKANAAGLSSRKVSVSSIVQNNSSRRPSGNTNSLSGHGPSFLLPTSGRRPSGGGVAGLMRTLSGTFSRENSSTPTNSTEGELPPLPNDATSNVRMHRAAAAAAAAAAGVGGTVDPQAKEGTKGSVESDNDHTVSVSSLPPSLPSLVFRNDDNTGEGFFVQNSPIAFLDTAENVGNKEPYEASPNLLPINRNGSVSTTTSAADSSHDNSTLSVGHDGNSSTRSGSFVSAGSTRTFSLASRENSADRLNHQTSMESSNSDPYEASQIALSSKLFNPQTSSSSDHTSNAKASPKSTSSSSQRQKIQTLFRSKALKDGPHSALLKEKHSGWAYISYKSGDTFRVLSTDSTSSPGQTLLFGRSDVSGEMGWVPKVDFVKLDPSAGRE